MNIANTLNTITVRPATTPEIIAYHVSNVTETSVATTVAVTKSAATGFWAGLKKGMAYGKPLNTESEEPKYFVDPNTGRVFKA
jgi:hypothetical protein